MKCRICMGKGFLYSCFDGESVVSCPCKTCNGTGKVKCDICDSLDLTEPESLHQDLIASDSKIIEGLKNLARFAFAHQKNLKRANLLREIAERLETEYVQSE